jgi:Helix-loop-helix DNA-binding domain
VCNRNIFAAKLTQLFSANTDAVASNERNARFSSTNSVDLSRGAAVTMSSNSADGNDRPLKKAKKPVAEINEDVREERNAREKERSFRISKQINEIRNLLSSGGVIVPKGTKSSVLTEAASYIRMLQQHQYRSELDRHQLIQQMQTIGSGSLGPQAAQTIRHVAAQNGVWSLGCFGGVPPKSAMSGFGDIQSNVPGSHQGQKEEPESGPNNLQLQMKIEDNDCRLIFNSCSVGMVS